MALHTCPRCELRFELEAEVRDHLIADHHLDPDAVRPHFTKAPPADRRLVVVVGNHTLLSERVRKRLATLTADGPTDVHVVVPVDDRDEISLGEWRGRALAERIGGPEVRVSVDVDAEDPVALVERSVHGAHVDRVVVSTLPDPLSGWVEADVAGRLRHTLGSVPVEVVIAEG
jgi:hypothetical protein